MIVLIKLILAHFIGDFLLQSKSWVQKKERHKLLALPLYLHVLIHGALALLLLWNWQFWPLALWVVAAHFVIDATKLYFQNKHKTQWFVIDQVLHLAALFLLWYFWSHPAIHLDRLWQSPRFWLYLTALLFLTVVSDIIIKVLLTNWAGKIANAPDAALPNAGKYIGIIERLFVFLFILIGHWEAIGFLLAAKSVFRFSDLKEAKDRKLTEYILTGTLLSFGIATATGVLIVYVV